MDISTFQSDVLGFVGQQAIAHAAEIFATLTAAFTFATGFKNVKSRTGTWLYVLFLTVLLTGGIYAFLRAYYYGVLSNAVFNQEPPGNIASLKDYWSFLANNATKSYPLVGVLALGKTIESFSISWTLGFVSAVALTSYLTEEGKKLDFYNTFTERLPWPFKVAFWWALIDYALEITMVQWLPGRLTQWLAGRQIVLYNVVISPENVVLLISMVSSVIAAALFVCKGRGGHLTSKGAWVVLRLIIILVAVRLILAFWFPF